MPDTDAARTTFLDAWEALCLAAGAGTHRRCLRASEALRAGTAAQREAVAAALAVLGYPQAMMSARTLAQALRYLSRREGWRPDAGIRYLTKSYAAGGGLWYVADNRGPEQAAA